MKIQINVNDNDCEIFINEIAVETKRKSIKTPPENIMVNLYVARKEKQLKQTEVARLINIHSTTYSKKERGELDFTLSEAFILADFFETTVDSLFADRKAIIE